MMALQECPRCLGDGRVADTDQGEPWGMWRDLPIKSAHAVILGLVRPMPCPRCKGSGKVGVHADVCESCTCSESVS